MTNKILTDKFNELVNKKRLSLKEQHRMDTINQIVECQHMFIEGETFGNKILSIITENIDNITDDDVLINSSLDIMKLSVNKDVVKQHFENVDDFVYDLFEHEQHIRNLVREGKDSFDYRFVGGHIYKYYLAGVMTSLSKFYIYDIKFYQVYDQYVFDIELSFTDNKRKLTDDMIDQITQYLEYGVTHIEKLHRQFDDILDVIDEFGVVSDSTPQQFVNHSDGSYSNYLATFNKNDGRYSEISNLTYMRFSDGTIIRDYTRILEDEYLPLLNDSYISWISEIMKILNIHSLSVRSDKEENTVRFTNVR